MKDLEEKLLALAVEKAGIFGRTPSTYPELFELLDWKEGLVALGDRLLEKGKEEVDLGGVVIYAKEAYERSELRPKEGLTKIRDFYAEKALLDPYLETLEKLGEEPDKEVLKKMAEKMLEDGYDLGMVRTAKLAGDRDLLKRVGDYLLDRYIRLRMGDSEEIFEVYEAIGDKEGLLEIGSYLYRCRRDDFSKKLARRAFAAGGSDRMVKKIESESPELFKG